MVELTGPCGISALCSIAIHDCLSTIDRPISRRFILALQFGRQFRTCPQPGVSQSLRCAFPLPHSRPHLSYVGFVPHRLRQKPLQPNLSSAVRSARRCISRRAEVGRQTFRALAASTRVHYQIHFHQRTKRMKNIKVLSR